MCNTFSYQYKTVFNRSLGGLQGLSCGVCVGVSGKCLACGNHRAAINSCWWRPLKRAMQPPHPAASLLLHPARPLDSSCRANSLQNLQPLHPFTHLHTHTHTQEAPTIKQKIVKLTKVPRFQSQNNIYSIVSKILCDINITKSNTLCVSILEHCLHLGWKHRQTSDELQLYIVQC